MRENKTFKITLMAMCVGFNIIGVFVALTLKLPIYFDTIGTFISAFLFGPIGGMITGIGSAVINGLTIDSFSLPFMPVQIVTGCLAGYLYKKGIFKGKLIPLGLIIVSVSSAIVGAIIAAYLFGGITSAGSSIIVVYLKEAGMNTVTSVFVTQILTDLLDKVVVVSIAMYAIKLIPVSIKRKYLNKALENK
ncbi:MAG: ECF transporter S component [Clostridium sp.]